MIHAISRFSQGPKVIASKGCGQKCSDLGHVTILPYVFEQGCEDQLSRGTPVPYSGKSAATESTAALLLPRFSASAAESCVLPANSGATDGFNPASSGATIRRHRLPATERRG